MSLTEAVNLKQHKGITILEIMVTVSVVSFGLLALLDVLNMGLFVDGATRNRAIALNLAREKMEEVKDTSSYANIDNYASARVNLAGEFADFDRSVTVNGDPKEVNVSVYWNEKGEEISVQLTTLFTDYGY